MTSAAHQSLDTLRTSAGDFPLNQYCFKRDGREWRILHVGTVLSKKQEEEFLLAQNLPYGITLWTASIALAHEIAGKGNDFKDKKILELGAGTGLPGIIAASCGATVIQTDRNELALSICARNQRLNKIDALEQRLLDWTDAGLTERFDRIIGSDILYSKEMHPFLERIFANNLTSQGRVLISDPFRASSFEMLEHLEATGWTIKINKWNIGEESSPRAVGVFELTPPQ